MDQVGLAIGGETADHQRWNLRRSNEAAVQFLEAVLQVLKTRHLLFRPNRTIKDVLVFPLTRQFRSLLSE